MTRRWSLVGIISVIFGMWIWAGGIMPSHAAEALDPAMKGAIETFIHDYLMAHPEVLEASLQQLEERRQVEARQRGREAVATFQKELFLDPESPISGNPSGDVTMVEFFDYRCRYCKAVAGSVTQLLKDDPNVRLVYKDFPILGDASVAASKAALASRAQGKYPAFHEALMAAKGDLTEAAVMEIAGAVGLDTARLQVDMETPAVRAIIEKNRALADRLGLTGTPAFIVGKELAPGALDLATMKELVAQARSK
jgi:protein-disulfide isomerase